MSKYINLSEDLYVILDEDDTLIVKINLDGCIHSFAILPEEVRELFEFLKENLKYTYEDN